MAKNKLKKFFQLSSYKHVEEPELKVLKEGLYAMKGNWKEQFFKNQNPIVLELGCGKGEYSVALAKKYPEKNFIGVDIKGARMWDGATKSLEENISNVGFLRTRIEWIEDCFSKDEVDEIWITFPDPQIKYRRSSKRLTHPIFLKKYNNILRQKGYINLKTDSIFLHAFTLGVISSEGHILEEVTQDLYSEKRNIKHADIKTYYESIFLKKNIPITYLRFQLNY